MGDDMWIYEFQIHNPIVKMEDVNATIRNANATEEQKAGWNTKIFSKMTRPLEAF